MNGRIRYVWGVVLAAFVAAASAHASASDPAAYVPTTTDEASITAAEPGQRHLTGISKNYPPICDGVVTTKLEDTGAKSGVDRTDIGPPSVEFDKLEPGRSYSYCLFVQNLSDHVQNYKVSAAELSGSDDPDQKQDIIRPPQSVGAWIHPLVTSVQVKPGFRQFIPYVVDVPRNPPRGTVAGALEIVRAQTPGTPKQLVVTLLHKVFINFPGGEAKPLEIRDVHAPRVLSRDMGQESYAVRFQVHNAGTVVETHHTNLSVSGLGRTIGKQRTNDSILLPNGTERVEIRVKDIPWIGFYRPKATVEGRAGKVAVDLPWLLVLPPWPFVVAFVLALLWPLVVFLRRWRANRRAWMQYLDEEDAPESDDEEWADDGYA